MFMLCLLYKDGSMERKRDMKDEKDLNSTKNGSKGKNPRQKKKIPLRAWIFVSFMCSVFCR
jgi:hypothetical protein